MTYHHSCPSPLPPLPPLQSADVMEAVKKREDFAHKLKEAWRVQGAEVVRGLYAGLMLVGHDGRPIFNIEWLMSLPSDVDHLRDGLWQFKGVKEEKLGGGSGPSSSTRAIKRREEREAPEEEAEDDEDAEENRLLRTRAGKRLKTPDNGMEEEADQQPPNVDEPDDVSEALSELTDAAGKKKWVDHMNWCNKKKAILLKAFTAISDAADEGARTTLAL